MQFHPRQNIEVRWAAAILTLTLMAPCCAEARTMTATLLGTFGVAESNVEKAHAGWIEDLAWIDNDTVVYVDISGRVHAVGLENKEELWRTNLPKTERWLGYKLMCPFLDGRLYALDRRNRIARLKISDGTLADVQDVSAFLGRPIERGCSGTRYSSSQMVFSVSIDESETEEGLDALIGWRDRLVWKDVQMTGSTVGKAIQGIGNDLTAPPQTQTILTHCCHSILIYDVENSTTLYRFHDDLLGRAIDVPFVSNAYTDGTRLLVYSIDSGWGTGGIYVVDFPKRKTIAKFTSNNGHLEMDVHFGKELIATTGTSQVLRMLNFEGRVLHASGHVSLQRDSVIRFSPDGEKVAIGSQDNSVRIFSIGGEAGPQPTTGAVNP